MALFIVLIGVDMRVLSFVLALLFAVAAFAGPASDDPAPRRIWITDVTIVSPENLAHLDKGSVLIENERFVRVERKAKAKPPATYRPDAIRASGERPQEELISTQLARLYGNRQYNRIAERSYAQRSRFSSESQALLGQAEPCFSCLLVNDLRTLSNAEAAQNANTSRTW